MWLDRFERADGSLAVVGISESGNKHLIPLSQMHKYRLPQGKARRTMCVTRFSDWTQASTKEYASTFGYTRNVSERHTVYKFQSGNITILLPALELQRALMSCPSHVVPMLYRPQGLDLMCSPMLGEGSFEMRMLQKRTVRTKLRVADNFIRRLDWFYPFPSAYRAWNSVYRFAANGQIAMTLPDAEILCSVQGQRDGDIIFARDICVFRITPTEEPLEWAKSIRREFMFHGIKKRRLANQTVDTRVRSRDGAWELTDEEWAIVEPLIHTIGGVHFGRPPIYDLRQIMDCIVEKLGANKSWSEVGGTGTSKSAIANHHRRMKNDGRWDRVVTALNEIRSARTP